MANFDGLYSKKVMNHIRRPRNMGEIKNADGVATVGNPICGDIMRLFIKVGKRVVANKRIKSLKAPRRTEGTEEYIKDIRFQTLGCGAAIATSSIITTMVKGKPLSQAERITKKAIAEALGGLPPTKMHCSVLAADALKKAIADYREKR